MTIQDLQKLDLYKCSLQDINKAYRCLGGYLNALIKKGEATANNCKGTVRYNEAKNLHVLITRARRQMTPEGVMIGSNINLNRLPNSASVL